MAYLSPRAFQAVIQRPSTLFRSFSSRLCVSGSLRAAGKRTTQSVSVFLPQQHYSTTEECSEELSGQGIVVGCYDTGKENGAYELTECAKEIDLQTHGKLVHMINVSGGKLKKGDSRLFYDITADNAHVVVVGVGSKGDNEEAPDNLEDIDEKKQDIRSAAAIGTKVLQKARIKDVLMDNFDDAKAAAEGSTLTLFTYDKLLSESNKKKTPNVNLLDATNPAHKDQWSRGCVLGSAQNFARELMESPANHMTPTMFVEAVSKQMGAIQPRLTHPSSVQLVPRPLSWIESESMGAFLSVAKGSTEPPWLLEVHYRHPESEKKGDQPSVLVGKGVTFDTGGISIKPSPSMGLMKGDMGGAACVVSTVMALAQLECPTSVIGLVPLCENMPAGNAVKPGDVVTAKNGKTIEVDNTDAEGRLLLADTLCYAHSFHPHTIIDLATLTGAIDVALGSGAAAVFSSSTSLWKQLHKAGHVTGDRLWRMPLYKQYREQIKSRVADINNIGTRGRSAGACTAAAFLKEFVEVDNWAHLDIAGVMESHGELPYLDRGMSGRPTRTLVQFLEDVVKTSN